MRALQRAFFADQEMVAAHPPGGTASHAHSHPLDPISVPERIGAVMLIGTSLVIGLYPNLLLDWIKPSFDSVLFAPLRGAGCL